ncbi:hypothetical protein QBC46DRAFT_381039 [Diplogelasinospora grovesii]|uniref:Transmembrane protein n=1 Tax=Diplogelasinospora grovesii TaxID=303347 RepID=A0AAN6NE33_9PEZI|nr:hypothetical protein QBC46DRAFT_381039 [Diplogelasinospora grovesii]
MTIDIDQVLFGRAKWRLRFLVPCWAAQVAMLLCLMGIFAYRLAETFEHYEENDKNGQIPMVEVVWEATNVGFSTISLVLSIIEISKVAAEKLTPFFMLGTHIIKLTLAFAILGLDVTVYLQRTVNNYSIVALAIDCGLLAVTIATFTYSLTTFRRLQKYDDYVMTTNSAKHGGHDIEMGNDVNISGGGARDRALYNRTISTEYSSQTSGLKGQVDRAIGAEFGWGGERSDTVIASGNVRSSKIETVRTDLPRTQSWATERGVITAERRDADDNDSETVRGSHDTVRHDHHRNSSIPTVLVSNHEEEEDTTALLPAAAVDGTRTVVGSNDFKGGYRDEEPRAGSSS